MSVNAGNRTDVIISDGMRRGRESIFSREGIIVYWTSLQALNILNRVAREGKKNIISRRGIEVAAAHRREYRSKLCLGGHGSLLIKGGHP